MSCPPRCPKSPQDTTGIGNSFVRSFADPRSLTPRMTRLPSPAPVRVSNPAGRYDSFQRGVRTARAPPLSSTMYSSVGGQSMGMSQDISAISSPPTNLPSSSQQTYVRSPARREPSPAFQPISERPSRTIRSSTVSKTPGKEVISEEVKEIFDRTPRRQPQYAGNATYGVAPLTSPRQVSFNPPANSTFYGQSMQDSSEMEESAFYTSSSDRSRCPYSTYAGYASDATYNRPVLPRGTFSVPRRYRDMSHVSPKSLYDRRTISDPYDSSGSPYDTRTYSEEISEIIDSSGETDDSLHGKIIRGEAGRNVQPMTSSDLKDAKYTKATYSVTPMQSSSSVECPCSDDASLSFNPPAASTRKKQMKHSLEDELTRREHEERVQLENDLYRWQLARRKLVLDTNLSDGPL